MLARWIGDAWPIVVHLNRFDGADALHQANASHLGDFDGFTVTLGIPALARTLL